MFELSFEKLIVIGLIATFLIGPERLPGYAAQLTRFIRVLRRMATDAKGRLEEELGPDAGVDWQRLDPRQYDPRRIIRDALSDDMDPADARRDPHPWAEPAGQDGDFDAAEDDDSAAAGFDPDPAHRVLAGRGAAPAVDDEAT